MVLTKEKPKMIEKEIFNLFKEIGIPTNLSGYEYLKTAVKLVCEDKEMKIGITKKLYPEVAKIHNSTPSRVERAIRHVIEVLFYDELSNVVKEIFGNTLKNNKYKPTNSHFICTIAECIKMSRTV
jgi:two-component system response regulator (stage 0 sporulation protein A)